MAAAADLNRPGHRRDDVAVAGAVLTGGASRRMGRDKATMPVDGVPMAARVAEALAAVRCYPIVLVGGDAARLAVLGRRVVDDTWPGEGPLGAVITALRDTATTTVVVACDLPWLDAATVEQLIETAEAHPGADVVHAMSARAEPLCALWRPSALGPLEAIWNRGERAVHTAIARLRAVACPVDPASLTNVNRPGDLPTG